MAKYQDGPDITLKAASGSCPAYRVVAPGTSSAHAQVWVTATTLMLGVSMEDASATSDAWKIRIAGTAKAQCGASVSTGSILTAQTDTGKVIQATITDNTTTSTVPRIIGVALESGSTNSVIEIQIAITNLRKEASA
jgi:hypothetical protein